MRKLLSLILFSFFSFCAFSEQLTGTWGFKFGMSINEVKHIMDDKGLTISNEEENNGYCHLYSKATKETKYSAILITEASFTFKNNKLYIIRLQCYSNEKGVHLIESEQNIRSVVYQIIAKYNLSLIDKISEFVILEKYKDNTKLSIEFDYSDNSAFLNETSIELYFADLSYSADNDI